MTGRACGVPRRALVAFGLAVARSLDPAFDEASLIDHN